MLAQQASPAARQGLLAAPGGDRNRAEGKRHAQRHAVARQAQFDRRARAGQRIVRAAHQPLAARQVAAQADLVVGQQGMVQAALAGALGMVEHQPRQDRRFRMPALQVFTGRQHARAQQLHGDIGLALAQGGKLRRAVIGGAKVGQRHARDPHAAQGFGKAAAAVQGQRPGALELRQHGAAGPLGMQQQMAQRTTQLQLAAGVRQALPGHLRQRMLDPHPVFIKQRQLVKQGMRGQGQRDAKRGIALRAECPVDGGAHVVHMTAVRGAPAGHRQALPVKRNAPRQRQAMQGMAAEHGRLFAACGQVRGGVRAGGFQQPVIDAFAAHLDADQRFRRQVGQRVIHIAACHGAGRRQPEAALEHAEGLQHAALLVVEQAMAPVQRGAQGLMAQRRIARTAHQQAKAVVELVPQAVQAEVADAPGRQLQRQRNAVQAAADLGGHRQVGVAQHETIIDGCAALAKQLQRRVIAQGRIGRRAQGRQFQRRQTLQLLARDAQRLAAGSQQLQRGRALEQGIGQGGGGHDHMFAIVQHDQHLALAQMGQQAGHRVMRRHGHAKRRGQRQRHQMPLGHRRQVDKADAVGMAALHAHRQRHRHRGLADAAGADNAEQAHLRQLAGHRLDQLGTAQHAREQHRQVVAHLGGGRRWRGGHAGRGGLRRFARARHRRQETVAAPCDRGDIAPAFAPVAQHLAQRRQVYAQGGVVDHRLWPDDGQQLVLVDDLAGALEQRQQQVHRAAAQAQGPLAFQQPSLERQ